MIRCDCCGMKFNNYETYYVFDFMDLCPECFEAKMEDMANECKKIVGEENDGDL